MEIKCPECGSITKISAEYEVKQLGCGNCKNLIEFLDNGRFSYVRKYDYKPAFHIPLKIGQKGKLNGIEYEVSGIVVKKVHAIYYWREYILTPKEGDNIYLSETNGHWMALKQIEEKFDISGRQVYVDYEGLEYALYEYEDTTIAYAEGCFDFELPKVQVEMIEYINPPYIISIEHRKKHVETYHGQHISAGAIKKAFGISSNPYRSGVGIVQPFLVDLRMMVIIFGITSLLILAGHVFIYSGRQQQTVLSQTLSFADYSGKDFVSRPFTLQGGSAPLQIKLQSGVDNSWASVQVGLVNEVTNEEIYSGKDVEYYHGYTDGENWSEGSQADDFYMCAVPEGRYHLVVSPSKAPEDLNNQTLSITASWNAPLQRNVFIPILAMAGIALATYFIKKQFERRRWADSRYSPYDQ
ncbi:DUF4178 domain-containing protein [Flavobacterium akiainvivens]|uniref:DUF4178 domain-containing protein n=1 Tax=Flavobacterium akiainvivens TaxID=1202724 RepID=UPI0006C83801|nr:DUF4178 domain-containing protein [Flavobacterium akiainvivens]SFQ15992.1 protein of unknown function [Flavobacterium akiainvivens]